MLVPFLFLFAMCVCVRLEISLQQNLIMDLFVDDCRALSDEDWMTGSNSGTHLKVRTSSTISVLTIASCFGAS